jgi:hypothetical protein
MRMRQTRSSIGFAKSMNVGGLLLSSIGCVVTRSARSGLRDAVALNGQRLFGSVRRELTRTFDSMAPGCGRKHEWILAPENCAAHLRTRTWKMRFAVARHRY